MAIHDSEMTVSDAALKQKNSGEEMSNLPLEVILKETRRDEFQSCDYDDGASDENESTHRATIALSSPEDIAGR